MAVVIALVIAGSANAFSVDLQPDSKDTAGQKLNFHTTLEDAHNVSNIEIKVGSITCNFDQEGNVIGACTGVELKKLSENTNNFGYGKTSKNFQYKVTVDRSALTPGSYTLVFKATTDQGTSSDSAALTVKAKGK